MATNNRNSRFPCGSRLKRKKCEDFHAFEGPDEDPDTRAERLAGLEQQRKRREQNAMMFLTAASAIIG